LILAEVQVFGEASSVWVDKTEYTSGQTVKVSFTNLTPISEKDWIGIYPNGVVPGSAVATRWVYTCGNQGCTGKRHSGTVQFHADIGEWQAFLLSDNGYTIKAQLSSTFTVSL